MRTDLCPRNRLISLSVLLATTLFSTAYGQAALQEPTREEIDALDRKRLITLEDGRIVRARSRFHEGRWEQRVGKNWVAIGGSVEQAQLEREVLAQARAMEKGLGKKDLSRRVAFADWLIQRGLHPEAISQIDKVLRVEPENAAALRTIRERPITLDLPDEARASKAAELRAVVIAGAGGSPAKREVAVMRLAEFAPYTDLRQVVAKEMNVPQNRRRAFAALAARRLFKGDLLRELSSRAMLDTFSDVRAEAARSLGAAGNVAALAPAINSLNSKFPSVRSNAAEAMGNMGYAAAVEPLVNHLAALQAGGGATGTRANIYIGEQVAYVGDFDVEIAQGASIADPIVNVQAAGVVFDVRTTVQMTKVIEMQTIMSSLRTLTGAKVPNSVNAWSTWWDENQGDWRSADHAKKALPAARASGGAGQ
ncbi:MAG: hypothetical protein GY711_06510 [bacterium]|nr:hypothetical protein [bacterium]